MSLFGQPPNPFETDDRPGGVARHAFEAACQRVEMALHTGKLITPLEALALAGPEARAKETLFSIARAVAWELDVDQDHLLRELGHRYPRFHQTGHHDHTLMSDS